MSLDVNFNESLTNDIVSFEQLGPGKVCHLGLQVKMFCIDRFDIVKIFMLLPQNTQFWNINT